MHTIQEYHNALSGEEKKIAHLLAREIAHDLPDADHKIWHGHPVWFLDENPLVGYSKLKSGIQLMFWSGQSFDEEALSPEGQFKAAAIVYGSAGEISLADLKRWLEKARRIQWDYKNIVKRKGVLERLK